MLFVHECGLFIQKESQIIYAFLSSLSCQPSIISIKLSNLTNFMPKLLHKSDFILDYWLFSNTEHSDFKDSDLLQLRLLSETWSYSLRAIHFINIIFIFKINIDLWFQMPKAMTIRIRECRKDLRNISPFSWLLGLVFLWFWHNPLSCQPGGCLASLSNCIYWSFLVLANMVTGFMLYFSLSFLHFVMLINRVVSVKRVFKE